MEKTLSIIKPDAVKKGVIGKNFRSFWKQWIKNRCNEKVQLSKEQAENFYAVHKERPF